MRLNKQTMREDLMETLAVGPHVIVFRKKNGTLRHMTGTRNRVLIPETMDIETPNPKHRENINVVPVFDLDKGAWRSFRIDGLEYIAPVR